MAAYPLITSRKSTLTMTEPLTLLILEYLSPTLDYLLHALGTYIVIQRVIDQCTS
ncbi:hypothetical protein O4444_03490 [Xylella fastidiosa subsp. pauca]|uniref:hypothetical protein n=1 Tax=Xylella fastidiosa TaxID=2371 RepID=UPI00040F3690|nr:hypothetical protein [Xylella fastidiosa]MDG5823914.1 hypothetical protein [Xylella fastidiosa subsp. pauca]WGZ32686.1 hypothetical protein O4444_03490 [Xylella fastidiosa subsp. pauca]